MKMHKKKIEKDDGRNLIFYTFDDYGPEQDNLEERDRASISKQSKKGEA